MPLGAVRPNSEARPGIAITAVTLITPTIPAEIAIARNAIMVLARDKRFLGADIGLIGVLQILRFAQDRLWTRLIRRYFREALKQSDFLSMVPDSVWRQDWVCQTCHPHG
jgi:hypothetical protein